MEDHAHKTTEWNESVKESADESPDASEKTQNGIEEDGLIREALLARERSYCPYSGFAVGAALLTADGKVYRGCNIENAAFTPTNCAERTAFFKAVSEGERNFTAIAIAGGKASGPAKEFCPPCGVCRQVMMEFTDPDAFRIILGTSDLRKKVYTLRELFPEGFGPANL